MTPDTLGPYRIDREIGVGGMGKVYAATLTREAAGLTPGTTVALEVVHPHLLETEGFFRRFLREADIGATVRHENVVRTCLADARLGRRVVVVECVEVRRRPERGRQPVCRSLRAARSPSPRGTRSSPRMPSFEQYILLVNDYHARLR